MKTWKVFLKFADGIEREKKLELYDAKTYFGGLYLKIKRSYFNRLGKIIKVSKKYSSIKGIEKVLSPDDDDWTFNPWMLIITKDNEKSKSFWFFIKREKDLSGVLVAIGPKTYAEYNNNNSEARREIKQIFNYIIAYLNKFQSIILLPNFLP
ncbi:MAG: hypothetical protein ACFFAN_06270 [Promethearchaeota archaeon]